MSVLGPGNERGPLIKVLLGNDFQLALKWAQQQGKRLKVKYTIFICYI